MENKATLSKKAFFGAAVGTMAEYYDYALFSLFLPIVAPIFFPADSAYASLVKGYFIYLIAMLARPFGGLIFGYIGDVFGRPKALLASMYGIALSSFVIGITPSYLIIGIWALIIIMIAKAIQTLCFGGEYNGAGIYVVEHAAPHRAALAGSLLTALMHCGGLLATLIGVVLTYSFMPAWSWRIAFILGGLIGIFGILYRKNLAPSPNFIPANIEYNGLLTLIKQFPRELLAGIFIGGLATSPFTTVFLFVLPIFTAKGLLTAHQFMMTESILTLFAIITLVIVGFTADKISPLRVMRFSCILLVCFSYSLLSIVDKGNLFSIIIAMAGIIVINQILLGPSNAYLKMIFPMQYRYRGSSISFCIGMSLFGGLTPIVENYLYRTSGNFNSASCWLILVGMGGLFSLELVRRKRGNTISLPDTVITPPAS